MDPKANLECQRRLAGEILYAIDSIPDPSGLTGADLRAHDERVADINESIRHLADDLAEHVLALDHWRRHGGFDPYGDAT